MTVLLSLLACPSDGSPTQQADQKPEAKDARPIISFSKGGLTVNGTKVQLNRTTKKELEKLLGPMERTFTHELRRDPIGFWDTKGVRIYFSKVTGVVDYLDCVLVTNRGLPDLDPKQPFTGVLQVDGVDISNKTTKAAIQGRVRGKVHDFSFNGPGFYVVHPHHDASFTLNKDRTVLELVRFSARP
jgi:hypothetical protein